MGGRSSEGQGKSISIIGDFTLYLFAAYLFCDFQQIYFVIVCTALYWWTHTV